MEERMLLDSDCYIKITRLTAHDAGAALPAHTQPRSGARSRRDAYLDRLRLRNPSFALACRAHIANFPGTAAAWTGKAESHRASHLCYVAGAVALAAGDGIPAGRARPVT